MKSGEAVASPRKVLESASIGTATPKEYFPFGSATSTKSYSSVSAPERTRRSQLTIMGGARSTEGAWSGEISRRR